MTMKKHLHTLLASLVALPALAEAATPVSVPQTRSGLIRQEVQQGNIGASLGRVARQLDAVIEEYDRNGLEGDDVDTLKRFRGMLNNLTRSEVTKIVKQLEQARLLKAENNQNAFGAFAGQKQVTVQLEQIYLEWQRQQIFRELSSRFNRLAGTQRSNMQRTVEMYNKMAESSAYRYRDESKIDLRIQELDQAGINDEAGTLIKKLKELNEKLDAGVEPRPKLAMEKITIELNPALDGALDDLKGSKLASAAGNERRARDAMLDLARILAPKRDKEEVIRQAIRDIEKAMVDQEQVKSDTEKLEESEEIKAENLERDQAELVDRTDLIREDVKDFVPAAADELKASTQNQQTARAVLNNNQANEETKSDQAAAQQEEAIENLADAKEVLEEQLEEMAEKANNPEKKDKLEQLKELAEKVAELKKKEQAIQEKSEKVEQIPAPAPEEQSEAEAARQLAEKEVKEAEQIARHIDQVLEKAPEEVKPAAEIAAKAAEEIAKALPEIEKRAEQGDADLKPELEKAAEQLKEAAEQAKQAAANAENNPEQAKKDLEEAGDKLEQAANTLEQAEQRPRKPAK